MTICLNKLTKRLIGIFDECGDSHNYIVCKKQIMYNETITFYSLRLKRP